MGLGACMVSMLLTIPCCLLLIRLRRLNVDDSITASTFALGGTIVSVIIGGVIGFGQSGAEIDPGIISSLITFIFFGTIFQFIESKLNRESGDGGKAFDRNGRTAFQNQQTPRPLGTLRLSRTRLGVFFLSGLWELITLGFQSGVVYFPSAFKYDL